MCRRLRGPPSPSQPPSRPQRSPTHSCTPPGSPSRAHARRVRTGWRRHVFPPSHPRARSCTRRHTHASPPVLTPPAHPLSHARARAPGSPRQVLPWRVMACRQIPHAFTFLKLVILKECAGGASRSWGWGDTALHQREQGGTETRAPSPALPQFPSGQGVILHPPTPHLKKRVRVPAPHHSAARPGPWDGGHGGGDTTPRLVRGRARGCAPPAPPLQRPL